MIFNYLFLFSALTVILFSIIYICAFLFRKKRVNKTVQDWPSVSIVVPMWNEEKTIAQTLDSIIRMKDNYDGEIEILVIDDHSTDNSRRIVESYTNKYDFIKFNLKKGTRGKSESLNQAIALSKFELFACVDADSYPNPNALKCVVSDVMDPKVGSVTTKLVVQKPRKLVEIFQYVEYIYLNFLLMSFDSMNAVYITRGPLSIYKKDVLEAIGGFLPADMTPTEDMEITFRIRKAGYQILASRTAKVYTTVMPTWKKLFWQRIRWNRGSIINYWMHKDMFMKKKYGLFSMFVFPSTSLMISVIGFIVIYVHYKIISFFITKAYYFYEVIKSEILFDVASSSELYSHSLFQVSSYKFLFIPIIITYILSNSFGLFESKERFKLRYFLTLIAIPFVYHPALVLFWLSAVVMQATKYNHRWK